MRGTQSLKNAERFLIIGILLSIAVGVVDLLANLRLLGLLVLGQESGNPDLDAQHSLVKIIGVVELAYVALLLVTILFFVWLFRLVKQLNALYRKDFMSPVWAVLWFFIPVANLWKPLKVMDAIEEVISSCQGMPEKEGLSVLWWVLSLEIIIIEIMRILLSADISGGVGDFEAYLGLGVLVSGIFIFQQIVALKLVYSFTEPVLEDGERPLSPEDYKINGGEIRYVLISIFGPLLLLIPSAMAFGIIGGFLAKRIGLIEMPMWIIFGAPILIFLIFYEEISKYMRQN